MPTARRFRQFATQRSDVLVALGLAVPVVGSVAVHVSHVHQPLILFVSLAAVSPILVRRQHAAAGLLLAVAAQAVMPEDRALLLPVMAVL